jgi:hypothetical protein
MTPSQTLPSKQTKKPSHNRPASILIFHLPPALAEVLLSSVALLGALELSQLAGSFQVPETLSPSLKGHIFSFEEPAAAATLAAEAGTLGKLLLSLFVCTVTVSTSGIQSLSFPTSARDGCECLLSKAELPPYELGMGDLPRVVPPMTRGQTVMIRARMPGMQAQMMARSVSVVLQ